MSLNYNVLKINSLVVKNITQYNVSIPKLWSSNTGRDLNGTNKGTLIGNFTKLEVTIGTLSADDWEDLITELQKATLTVQYYDPSSQQVMQESMYAGDISAAMKSAKRRDMKSFSFSLIGNQKRTKATVVSSV